MDQPPLYTLQLSFIRRRARFLPHLAEYLIGVIMGALLMLAWLR